MGGGPNFATMEVNCLSYWNNLSDFETYDATTIAGGHISEK
jgi:hypothetical protein